MIRKAIFQRLLFFIIMILIIIGCVSGADQDVRNADIFNEARQLQYSLYQESNNEHDGNINALLTAITALPDNNQHTIPDLTVSGLVTIPSSFAFTIDSNICSGTPPEIYLRSFVLQDQNGGILVAFGLHPADTNVANSNSMKYWANAGNPNIAVFGDVLQITVTKAIKYGTGSNVVAVVTDFKNPTVLSRRNSIPFQVQSGAFNRASDLYRMRQLVGFVTTSPAYRETTCGSGPYRFQVDHQQAYWGTLCVGATSFADAQTCSGGTKVAYRFKLSTNLGAGTLSGFDVDDMFSYNLARGAYVRLRGPVIVPTYAGGDTDLTLLIDQKHQVETLTAPSY